MIGLSEITAEQYGTIGILYWGLMIFLIFFGISRNNKVLFSYFIGSLILTTIGLIIFQQKIPWTINSNVAGVLFAPLLYVIFYTSFRKFYKTAYKFEPDYVPHSNYSHRDNRKLNLMDFLSFFIPTIFSILISLFISRNF